MLPTTHRHYPLPYHPRDYFLVPADWLACLQRAGCVDSLLLLLAQHRSDGIIAFTDSAPEAAWVRSRDPRLANIVSHPTYFACMEEFTQRKGWLASISPAPGRATGAQYRLTEWPHFNGAAIFYLPRSYIEQRWSARLRPAGFAVRAALVAAFACVSTGQESAAAGARVGPAQPFTHAQLKAECQRLFPQFALASKLGAAVQHLEAVGLLERMTRADGAPLLRLDPARLTTPDDTGTHNVATAAGLDEVRDALLVELVGALLDTSGLPATHAGRVTSLIHSFDPHFATPEAQRGLIEYVQTRRQVSPLRLRRVLRDYLAQRHAARLRWVAGDEMVLSTTRIAEDELVLPTVAHAHPQATQLVVEWQPRAGRKEAEEATLAATTLELRQENRILAQLSLNDGRRMGGARIVVDGSWLHSGIRDQLPVTVTLRCDAPRVRLALHIYARILVAQQ